MLKPLDIRHGFGICVAHDGVASFDVLGVNRRSSVGPVSPSELVLIRELRPHLVNIYAIHCRLADAGVLIGSLRESFNSVQTGILLLDELGQIIEANETANAILDSGSGLFRGPTERLCASSPSGKERLRLAIAELPTRDAMHTVTILLAHPRGDAARRVVLNMRSVSSFDLSHRHKTARIICFLNYLSQTNHDELDQKMLQNCFGLTGSEAKVVQLLRRLHSAGAVALQMGVAENTVRTHIKSAFRKTETQRQSELIQIADRVVSAAAFRVR